MRISDWSSDVCSSDLQSFGGGQQPGIGFNVPGANGVDVGGGSSINLRGLGSDATLTLLNGHRLSYSSSRQSVDVSAIPLSAVDRLATTGRRTGRARVGHERTVRESAV